jgi:hypothetical protein
MNEATLSVSSSPASPALPRVQTLSAAELLRVWERGQDESPVERALSMLASACPAAAREALAELSIGQRDACLLEVRERLFGTELSSLADCPGCAEQLELNFRTSDVRVSLTPKEQPLSIERSAYELSFRLPNSLDLMALPAGASVAEMRGKLFDRCLLRIERSAKPLPLESSAEIPVEIVDAVIECMSEADRQADVRLDLTCPCCELRWKATFDIVSYLWSELQERAMHLMREIHLLASAYGWREGEILALSSSRRQRYLEMVTG